MLAGAQVEGHAGPAPVLDLQAQSHISLHVRIGRHLWLLAIARDLAVGDPASLVLAAHDIGVDAARGPVGVDGAQYAYLLVTQRVGLEVDGWLHGHQAEQLQHVVLQDVAAGAGLLVERAPALHAKVLGHGDLDVVDVATVPDRLEDAIAEAEDQQVADGVLAQVMIDAIDLRLVEGAHHRVVEIMARFEIMAEGLLDDDAAPRALAVRQPCRAEVGHDVLVGTRWCGEVEEAVATAARGRVDLIQPLG